MITTQTAEATDNKDENLGPDSNKNPKPRTPARSLSPDIQQRDKIVYNGAAANAIAQVLERFSQLHMHLENCNSAAMQSKQTNWFWDRNQLKKLRSNIRDINLERASFESTCERLLEEISSDESLLSALRELVSGTSAAWASGGYKIDDLLSNHMGAKIS